MSIILSKKRHVCNLCGSPINNGEHYHSINYFTYRFKSHIKCYELVDFLDMCDVTEDNTVNYETFNEIIKDEYSLIMSEKYTDIYESVNFKLPTFEEQINFVYQYYIIEKNGKIVDDILFL